MILSLKFREQMSGFLAVVQNEFDNIVATIRAWSNVEHNDNGTHAPNVGNTLQFLAGANIGVGQPVYVSAGADQTAAGQAFLADASAVSKSTQAAVVGLATVSVAAGANVVTRDRGIFSGLAGLTAGKVYYLGTTAGTLTLTQPTNAVLVGLAVSTTELLLLLRNPTTITGIAILTWSGPTSGSQNMQTGLTLALTTAGTYTITVSAPMTLTFKGTAGGGGGGGGSSDLGNQRGGGGGGGGATTTGTSVSLITTQTYTLIIGAGGAGGASNADGTTGTNTKFSGSATLVELAAGVKGLQAAGGGGAGGALITGTNGITGAAGGNEAVSGSNIANGAAGGGGGGGLGGATGGSGGNGSVTGGAGGGANVAGVSKSGSGGSAKTNAGGGGGAGGAKFTVSGEPTNGAGGGGGGGAGETVSGAGATGGAGGDGDAAFVFVSAP